MKKLKVALIHNIIAPYRIPLFNELARNPNLDLHVYFDSKSETNRDWIVNLDNSYKYQILEGFTLKIGKQAYYHINPSIFKELIFGNYDIIISAGYSSFSNQIALLIAKILNIKFILWSGSTVNEPNLLRKLSLPLIKCIVQKSDGYIAYGTRAKEYLMHLGAPDEKIFLAYNTVDTDFFHKEHLKYSDKKDYYKDKLGIKEEIIIMYSGQLVERKGIRYLLDAYINLCQKYDSIGLLIVGNGDLKDELAEMCKNKRIDSAHFVGFVQKEELPLYYSISDIFVLPSSEEVWGLVINEAMACGLPIITTRKVGASVDLVKEGKNGFVVKENDVAELENALGKIIINQNLKKNMSVKSKEIVESRFTIKNASLAFKNAIVDVIEK